MNYRVAILLAVAVLGTSASSRAEPVQQSILGYHGNSGRSGNFLLPALTWDRARSLHLDENFQARVTGHIYAQPLLWRAPGSSAGILVVATEDNIVHAL